MDIFKEISEWISTNTGINTDIQQNILFSVIIIISLWLIRKIILIILSKKLKSPKLYLRWKKSLTYIFLVLGLMTIGRLWFEWFQSITVYLGFLSAGLAVAAKDIIMDLAGFIYIILKKPLRIGDRIIVGENAGDVIDRQFFQFILMEVDESTNQRTGNTLYVPNSFVFLKVISNYRSVTNFIWKEIKVQVTFDSDIQKATDELQRIVKRHSGHPTKSTIKAMKKTSKKYMLSYSSIAPNIFISGNENGVILNVRYVCFPEKCREIEHNIWMDIVKSFNEIEGIEFSYSVSRVLS